MIKHLKKSKDFITVSQKGTRWVTPGVVVIMVHQSCLGLEMNVQSRVGFTASRRIGGAVQRNYAKRRLRALAQEIISEQGMFGNDYVLIARQEILTRDFKKVKKDLLNALKHLHKEVQDTSMKDKA